MSRDVCNFLIIAAGLVVVVILAGLLSRCVVGTKTSDAVRLDAAEVSADGFNRGMVAERAATMNQLEAERAFANDQAQAEDKIDEAVRTRRSPLDTVLGELR